MVETLRKISFSELKEARNLFGENDGPSSTFRQAVRRPDQTLDKLRDLREKFGDGNLGQSLFEEVAAGKECNAKVVLGEECKELATGTVDFDVFADAVSIYTCPTHSEVIEMQVDKDITLGKISYSSSSGIGRNGKGRA